MGHRRHGACIEGVYEGIYPFLRMTERAALAEETSPSNEALADSLGWLLLRLRAATLTAILAPRGLQEPKYSKPQRLDPI